MLLAYAGGPTVPAIAHDLGTNQPRVERCVDNGLQVGPLVLLGNLPWPGRRRHYGYFGQTNCGL